MKLTFLGAAGTVTGSKYLLEDEGHKILVDCGLFQGIKDWRTKNWDEFPVDPKSLSCVILTHAHIDHSGYLPVLVKNGFSGPVYCTDATADLCGILLPDSAHLQEEDAERANRYGYSKHKPALPLYTREDADKALALLKTVSYGQDIAISDLLSFKMIRAGHILGASSVRISDGLTSILFSGDIGRYNDPLMVAPSASEGADYVVLESTYGDRLHPDTDVQDMMADIINKTAKRGGMVIVPSFAVGRAQLLMYHIHQLKQQKRIPDMPVFLDSPMAINASKFFQKYHEEHRLSQGQAAEICATAQYVHTREDSKALDTMYMPSIIVSASGMATGGRILHHLKSYISDPKNTILFAGYQAAGTRGAELVAGVREITIHGTEFPVRAEIVNLTNLSAHADYEELMTWIGRLGTVPRKIYLTHGEPKAALAFKDTITQRMDVRVEIPEYLEQIEF